MSVFSANGGYAQAAVSLAATGVTTGAAVTNSNPTIVSGVYLALAANSGTAPTSFTVSILICPVPSGGTIVVTDEPLNTIARVRISGVTTQTVFVPFTEGQYLDNVRIIYNVIAVNNAGMSITPYWVEAAPNPTMTLA